MGLTYVTAGESHGPGLTVVVSGLPAGLELDHELIRADLARPRRSLDLGGHRGQEDGHMVPDRSSG